MTVLQRLQASLGTAYILERELTGGGMAHVFLAEERALGRRVVVKVLPDELAGSINVDRFGREIQVAAQLQHPCIVPVLTAGTVDGVPYYTMPFVEGKSLRDRLTEGGALSVPEALKALRDLASALAYAHERGIVHRDIKPENVLLADGYALVTDFGVAKALSLSASGSERLTVTGIAIGTPGYMSPEQASGDPHVDQRADIYAFGCTAYEVLVGRPPFAGRSWQEITAAHLVEVPEVVTTHRPAVPPALSTLIARCLEKRPADRPQTARDLVRELDAVATPAGGTVASKQPASRRLILTAGIAAAAALGAAAVVAARRESHVSRASHPQAKRVVVRTFTNSSGDKSLDPLGLMAADWIARGLTETGSVDVAGTEAEITSAEAQTKPGAAMTPVAIGKLVKAKYVISGKYYTQNDSLVFQADVFDADAGTRVLSVAPLSDAIASRQAALERLRQRVAGALVPFFDSSLVTTARTPPTYAAYQEFLVGVERFSSDVVSSISHLQRAAELDSTFVLPRLRLISQYERIGRNADRDSVIAEVQAHRATLSPYEIAAFDMRVAIARRDYDAAYRATMDALRLAPSATTAATEAGEVALLDGRPHEALRLLEPLDPEAGVLRFASTYFNILCRAYHAVGDLRKMGECRARSLRQFPAENANLIRVAGATGDEREVEHALDSVIVHGAPPGLVLAALFELEAHGHADAARTIAQKALGRTLRHADDSASADNLVGTRMMLLWVLGNARELAVLSDSVIKPRPNPTVGAFRGMAAALLGDTIEARRRADSFLPANGSRIYPQGRARARILAAMGDRAGALAILRVNTAPLGLWQFHDDPIYRLMRGYAPFEEFIKPRD